MSMKRNAPPSNEGEPLRKMSCTPGKHVEFIQSNKTKLVDIISFHHLTKDKVLEKFLITFPEYNDLKNSPMKNSLKTSELLDLLMTKGDEICAKFLHLLRDDEAMTTAYPRLKDLPWNQLDTTSVSRTEPDPKDSPRANTGVVGPVSGPKRGQLIEVFGYIHTVSTLRSKRKGYFQAKVQERDQTRQVFVFQANTQSLTNIRDCFLKAETEKSPVMLQQVLIKTFEDEEKIIFNELSTLDVLVSLPFPFDPSHMVKHIDLDELQAEETYEKRVNVKVEIVQKLKLGHRLTRDNRYIHSTVYLVADRTASMSLTVWELNNLTEKKWYSMSNLSVGRYNYQVTLQTTLDSAFEEIPCRRTSLRPSTDVLPPQTYTLEIVGFQLNPEKLTCRESHLLKEEKGEEGKGVTVHCERCDLHYLRGKLKRVFSGRLSLEDFKPPLELEDCHIRGLLGNNMVEDKRNTLQNLKEALSKIYTVEVTIYDGNLLSVSPVE